MKTWLERKHPDIRYCEAVLKAFMEDMGNSFLFATDDDFEYSLATTRTIFSRRRVPTEAQTKAALIEKICELIASKDGTGRDGKFPDFQLKQERKKYQLWTVEQLTARLDEVIRKQTLNAKPIEELKQIVVGRREEPSLYPKLPEYTRDGKSLDAAYLENLIRFDRHEFIRLAKLYGSAAIDRRRGLR